MGRDGAASAHKQQAGTAAAPPSHVLRIRGRVRCVAAVHGSQPAAAVVAALRSDAALSLGARLQTWAELLGGACGCSWHRPVGL
jgi:hypothetical protein